MKNRICSALLCLAMLGVAFCNQAFATGYTLPDPGVDLSSASTAFTTQVGTYVAIGVGVALAMTAVAIGLRWLLTGAKKR